MAQKYNTSLICTLLLCRAAFLLYWACFDSSKHFSAMQSVFFSYAKHLFSYAETFSALPSIFLQCWSLVLFAKHFFLLCWALLSSSKHFSATLSTSRLFQSFLFYAERCLGSSKHFSGMLSIWSALPSIFHMCWALFSSSKLFSSIVSFFSALPCIFCSAVYCAA